MYRSRIQFFLILSALLISCNAKGPHAPDAGVSVLPDASKTDPANPPPSNPPPSNPPASGYSTAVLLFNGTGVSTSDWQSTEQIVKSLGLSYRLVNSSQLNAMTLDELASFGLIIVPGGSGGTIAGNLTTDTRLRLRQVVREHGVGYVGFCAGAWVAVGPEAETARVASYGFAIAKGSVLDLFLPGGSAPTAAMVDVSFADGSNRSLVWWGGPSTPEWQDGVVARYDTGEPAISQAWAGKGLVVISGPHPEAPQGWRATAGNDGDGLDYDIAIGMIQSALTKTPMKHF